MHRDPPMSAKTDYTSQYMKALEYVHSITHLQRKLKNQVHLIRCQSDQINAELMFAVYVRCLLAVETVGWAMNETGSSLGCGSRHS